MNKDLLYKSFLKEGIEIKPAYREIDGQKVPNWIDENGLILSGIYDGIPNEVYHSSESYSNSQIKVFRDSPAHFYFKYLDPDREKDEGKRPDYFVAGDLIHALCLEPDEVYKRYYSALDEKLYRNALRTTPEIEAALKAAGQPKKKTGEKKADQVARLKECCPDAQVWDDVVAQHADLPENRGKTAIPHKIWKKAHRAHRAVMSRSEAAFLLSDGLPELSIFARCPNTGFMLRVRPDWLRLNGWIIDVKSTTSAKPSYWSKQARDLGYHCQDAFYRYVYSLATGKEAGGFGFITVEFDKAPICEPYEVADKDKHIGEEQIERDLAKLADCTAKNSWPGYTESGVTPLHISSRY